jgi:hypothetical protein
MQGTLETLYQFSFWHFARALDGTAVTNFKLHAIRVAAPLEHRPKLSVHISPWVK